MKTQSLLDQLFKSGQELLKQGAGDQGRGLADGLGGLLKSQGGSLLSGAGGGVLAALLMNSKSARKLGSNALVYGGLAALGVMAYKAYSNWQSQQGGATPASQPQTLDRLPPPQAEQHSQAILRAMIAAAKADGHVDERERQLIEEQLGKLPSAEHELRQWLSAELNQPLDPAAVARSASSPEMAAEMYLASLLMVDEEHFLERAYLDELARQLRLDPALKLELESQVRRELGLA